jgi:hypothetical protein
MIKKTANIVIVILLLVATAGIPFTRHYCGSSSMSFSIYSTPKACCEGHCDKCHNVFKFTKVNDDFEVVASNTTQSFAGFVTLQSSLYIDLLATVIISPSIDLPDQRATFKYKAGHSPASFGNFRC